MEGGHLLGQGSYGCAFTPPLLCKTYKGNKSGKVGKVTKDTDAQKEVEIANLLRSKPLVKNYILLPDPELCEPAPLKNQKDKEIKNCEAVMRENEYKVNWKETRQIFIPFGGKIPIGNLLLSSNIHPKYFAFFDMMKHVLEAGALLATSGVCHFDLHPNNFIQDNYGVVRILDLGQAFNARTIDEEVLRLRWKVLFFGSEKDAPHPVITNSEAPEITVMNAVRNGFETADAVKNVIQGKEIFNDIEKILGIPKTVSSKELQQFFDSSDSFKLGDYVGFWKYYWPGFDSWAIGCLLLTILSYQLSWTEFHQGEWQSKQQMTLLTLKGLLHPSPRKRLDCVEALFLYDPNNAWIRRFGKPWLEKRKEMRAKLPKN